MNRWRLGLCATLSAIAAFMPVSTALAKAPGPPVRLGIALSKPAYSTKGPFSGDIAVVNPNRNPLDAVVVEMRIYRQITLEETRLTFSPRARFSEGWFSKVLPPGRTTYSFKHSGSEIGLREGAYPMRVRVLVGGRTVTEKETTLVLVNPGKSPPLIVSFVWNLHTWAHNLPSGSFGNEKAPQAVVQTAARSLKLLRAGKSAQTTANLSPVLIDQLSLIAKGYDVDTPQGVKHVASSDPTPKAAQAVLDILGRMAESGAVEPALAPYSHAGVQVLLDRGWKRDVTRQLSLSRTTLKEALGIERFAGFYPPGLTMQPRFLTTLTGSEFDYVVLGQNQFSQALHPVGSVFEPHRIENADGKRMTVFFRSDVATHVLESKQERSGDSAERLLGVLAKIYLEEPSKKRVVVIAPTKLQVGSRDISRFYKSVGALPWLRLTGLKSASESVPTNTKAFALSEAVLKESYLETEYYDKVDAARHAYKSFAAMVGTDNPTRMALFKALMTAEASDWTQISDNPNKVNAGLAFVDFVTDTVEAQLDKITIPPTKVVVLTSQQGKIPLAVINGADYPVVVTLRLAGPNLTFPRGNNLRVTLKPKENFFTLPIIAELPASSKLKITLESEGRIIRRAEVTVRAAYLSQNFWLVLVLAASALAAVIAWQYLRVRRLTETDPGED